MNNLIVFPMIIPIIIGIILIFLQNLIHVQRWLTFFGLFINVVISLIILNNIQTSGIVKLDFGDWLAPFGISFVADSFATLLVLTASIVSIVCLLYAMATIGSVRERLYFYPFVNFLVAGVNGSFLTGDLFNLFVTFEVMLLASYALISLGNSSKQLKVSLKYIAINVVSSSLLLIAIAYLYGTVGTLNMAHLSVRISEVGQPPLITIISVLFLIVFSIKGALVLYHWLPGSYSAPPTAIAALFGALLTKVGIYALFRVFTLLFYHEPAITHTLIGIMACLTLIGGSLGAIAYEDIRQIVSYNVIIAVGFILVGLAIMTNIAIEGAIFYTVHDMIVKALLFLVAGTMIQLTQKQKIDDMSGLIRNYPTLGWILFITILSLTGIPPLSGFLGKVLIGQAAIDAKTYGLLAISFLSSIAVLYSLLRIFMNCFWGETIISKEEKTPLRFRVLFPPLIFVIITFALGLGAEGVAVYIKDASHTLINPDIYIDAVLNN